MNKHSSKHKQTTNIPNMSKILFQTWTNIVPNINKQHPIHEQTTLSQTWINNNPYINKQHPNINKQHPKHEQTTSSQTQINIPHPNKHYDPKHEQPPSQKHEQRTPPQSRTNKRPQNHMAQEWNKSPNRHYDLSEKMSSDWSCKLQESMHCKGLLFSAECK